MRASQWECHRDCFMSNAIPGHWLLRFNCTHAVSGELCKNMASGPDQQVDRQKREVSYYGPIYIAAYPVHQGTDRKEYAFSPTKTSGERTLVFVLFQLIANFDKHVKSLALSNMHSLSEAFCSRCILKNIVAKGEIAHDEQFLLLTQCFHTF